MPETVLPDTDKFDERTTGQVSATVVNEAGTALPAASLATLTLTLYDRTSGTIINSRDNQNVLNTNGVTVDSAGVFLWTLTPLDTIIVDATKSLETHVGLFTWTYDSGTKTGRHEIVHVVRNLTKVT